MVPPLRSSGTLSNQDVVSGMVMYGDPMIDPCGTGPSAECHESCSSSNHGEWVVYFLVSGQIRG